LANDRRKSGRERAAFNESGLLGAQRTPPRHNREHHCWSGNLRLADLLQLPYCSLLFELVVNLKTVKALGITIPESIMLRADAVTR